MYLSYLGRSETRQRAVFLLPMRALVNDKFEQFTRLYGPAGIRTIRATGEHSDDIPELLRGQFDIALLTYGTYAALILGNPHLLDVASTVVVDEAQMLTDRSRGSNLEFLLTLLNVRRGRTGVPQILTLSAVVGDMGGLDRWLGGRQLHWEPRRRWSRESSATTAAISISTRRARNRRRRGSSSRSTPTAAAAC